jgi:hypothetical protein
MRPVEPGDLCITGPALQPKEDPMSSLAALTETGTSTEPAAIQRARIGRGEIVAGWALIGVLMGALLLM